MKHHLFAFAVFLLSVHTAHAGTVVMISDKSPLMMPVSQPVTGTKPVQKPGAPPAKAGDNNGAWDAAQVDKLCYLRANGSAQQFDTCVRRNKFKIGRPKQAGEISELNLADEKLTEKALERAPSQ